MSTKTVDLQDIQTQPMELLSLVLQGTEVIFAKNNIPLARLVPISTSPTKPRVAGLHKGTIQMSDDFDKPLPDTFWLGTTT